MCDAALLNPAPPPILNTPNPPITNTAPYTWGVLGVFSIGEKGLRALVA